MKKFLSVLFVLSLSFLFFASQGAAAVIVDNFDVAHDYLTSGTAGTIWDGIVVNDGIHVTQDAVLSDLETSSVPGALNYVASRTHWEAGEDDGALLYIMVEGDFDVSVTCTDGDFISYSGSSLNYLSAGIMARDPVAANRDHVYIRFFDRSEWGAIHQFRSENNGSSTNINSNVGTVATYPTIRLVREGDVFTGYIKDVGGMNETLVGSYTRADMPDTVQLGLAHAIFSTNTGYVVFDDFSLIHGSDLQNYARNPDPSIGEDYVSVNTDLAWTPGENVQPVDGHQVFIGTVEQDVNDATVASHPDVDLDIVSNPACQIAQLEPNKPYFWRVDEVNDTDTWKGDIWNFTTESGKATQPIPADDYVSAHPDTLLSWTASGVAGSHDIYLGTDEAIVTNAERPAEDIDGDIDNDDDVDHNDVLLLTQQWLLDPPVGELPSADLNGDDDVDFNDLAILANDWMEGVYHVFKGNQLSTTFDPGGLDETVEYFWRIDEVNEDQTWKGDTWSFTTLQTTGYYYWPEYTPTLEYDYVDEYGEISSPTQYCPDGVTGIAGTYTDGWWTFRWGPDKNDLVTEDAWIPMLERFNEDFSYITDIMRWPRDSRALNGYYSTIYLYGSGLSTDNEPNTATGGWQGTAGGYPMVLASYVPVAAFDPSMYDAFQTGAMIHEGIHCILSSMPGCTQSCWFNEGGNTWLQGTMESQRSGNFSSIGWLSAGAAIAPFMPIECYSGWLQDDSFGGPCAQGVNMYDGGQQICTWRNLLGGTQYGECFPHALEIILGPKSIAWLWRNCHYSDRVLQDMAEAPGGLGDAQTRRVIQEFRARQAFCDFGQWSYAFRQLLNNNWNATIDQEWSPYWIDCDVWHATCYVDTTQNGSELTPEERTLPGWSGANQIPLTVDSGAAEAVVTFNPIGANMSCQLVYRDTSGNIHYGAPISSGACSIPLANVRNNVIVAVICNTDYIYYGESTRTAKYDYTLTMGAGVTGKANIYTRWYDYSQSSYTITATSGDNGDISPSGAVSVGAGGSRAFTFNPDPGYEVDEVILNGLPIGALSSYIFNNVRGNHTISVTFVAE